ncbi:hypothetical protein A5660_12165 [Mycobacterium alsense]|uniref:PE family protein n=1 Tax=Mycobacterium alsense TaxID=324058 RepID=UPI0008002025|nr:PE family protein [Mycobacterium alsense]OBI94394.1 hypothetical protein A5660_12165 [Mycobacterium alsense]
MAPAAADEVSTAIASLFSQQAQDYYAQARQLAASQEQFARNLTASAASYASTDDVIAFLLRGLDAEVRYYTTAGLAFGDMILLTPAQLLIFALFPPLFLLYPLLKFAQVSTLLTEVISRQPISYPYIEGSVTLGIIRAFIPGFFPTAH